MSIKKQRSQTLTALCVGAIVMAIIIFTTSDEEDVAVFYNALKAILLIAGIIALGGALGVAGLVPGVKSAEQRRKEREGQDNE